MMGEGEMVYGDYYSNYDNNWSIIPPDYGADLAYQVRQPPIEEDYKYNSSYAWVLIFFFICL